MSCIITYKGNKYTQEQFKEYISSNKNEFSHIIASNKNVIDSFKRKMKGIDFVFSQSPELASIGSKAQYLQYLSTIFKTSKVKDIVYHGGKTNKDSFKRFVDKTKYKDRNPNSILGFFFSSSRNIVASQYAEKDYDAIQEQLTGDAETDAFIRRSAPLKKGSVSEELINIKNPYIIQAEEWENETWVDKLNILTDKDKDDDWVSDYKWTVDAYEKVKNHLQSLGYDGLYINSNKELFNKTGIVDYITVQKVVFEPEQIHILSGKKDLEMFKNFVNFTKSEYAKYGDIQQFRDYIMSKNFAAIEEFLVVNNKIDRKC